MAASTAQGIIDPTKAGKYPIVLSDALLGKSSKESYTGIRCEAGKNPPIAPYVPP